MPFLKSILIQKIINPEIMEALLIKSDDKEKMKLLNELVKKLGIEATALSEDDIEDLGLSFLMKQADRKEHESRDVIMDKLK